MEACGLDLSLGDEPQDERLKKALAAMANGEDIDFDLLGDMDSDNSPSDQDVFLGDESSEAGAEGGEDVENAEDVIELRDPSSDDSEDELRSLKNLKRKRGKHSELDDDFFDLAAFNAETEQAEARSSSNGRLGGEEDSDEDIDMSVDLFAL